MRQTTFEFSTDDGEKLFVYRWQPDGDAKPRAIVHIAHGMAEHAARYERVAQALTRAGYDVYANDHRGHGRSARAEADLGWFGPHDSWNRVVKDLRALLAHERAAHPGVPQVLIGHSMGSYMAQQVAYEDSAALKGVVLSGSSGKPPPIAAAGRVVARIERARLGPRGRSKLLTGLSFDTWNKAFAPNRTKFDWLSRDHAEVDRYVADPRCGFMVSTQLWVDLLDALGVMALPANQARIPKDLPVYIIAGALDPAGEKTKGLKQLVGAYERAGLRNVTKRFYEGARHEVFNESNRDEVLADLLAWLDRTVPAA